MKNRTNKFTWFLLLGLGLSGLSACSGDAHDPALIGNWKGKEWLIAGNPSGQDAAKVYFNFKPDGTYTAGYGDQGEAGKWHTGKNVLYTKAEGRKAIAVKIMKADGNTLQFEMNRAGQQETLELVKAQ